MSLGAETARTLRVIAPLGATPTSAQELELIAGSNITLTGVRVGARLELTIAGTGGGGGAPTGASYVVLGTDATLTAERVLTAGHGVDIVDAGAGSTITVDVDETELDLASMGGTLALGQIADIATDRLLGRDTAGAGDVESLTVGGGIEFTGSGGIQRSALSGDVTASAGSGSVTVTQARGLRETAGPTTLAMGAVADGQLLKRSGSTIIGVYIVLAHLLPAQSGPYNVLTPTGQHATFSGSTWV